MVIPDVGHEGEMATFGYISLISTTNSFHHTLSLQAVDFVQITFLTNGESRDVMQYKFELLARS
jgi:hypothetical protein